jgi:hypothetical protein
LFEEREVEAIQKLSQIIDEQATKLRPSI